MTVNLEEIKAALQATTQGKHVIGKQSPNGLQNIGVRGVMTAQVFELGDAVVYSNAPEWLTSLITQVEDMKKVLEFYADNEKYKDGDIAGVYDCDVLYSSVVVDGGDLAKKSLQRLKGESHDN